MKKRGFTLIELLAVIVILAIIALIATPAVLNIIEDSEKSAAERSMEAVVKAAEVKYMTSRANGETWVETLNAVDLKVDNKPTAGTVTVDVSDDGTTVTITAEKVKFKTYECEYKNSKATCKNTK